MKRRTFVKAGLAVGGAALGGGGFYGTVVEPGRLDVTRHHLTDEADGFRVVQISDLHLGEVGDIHEEVGREVAAAEPHLVVLTGDSVDGPEYLSELWEFLDLLPDGAAIVAVMGNWEYWGGVSEPALRRVLKEYRGFLLVNDFTSLLHRGRHFFVTGVDDVVAGRPELPSTPPKGIPANDHLLLSHCPVYRDRLPADGPRFGLVLSGHTHGGQVNLLGLAVTPEGSGPYVRGWYRDDGPPLYVSRGVGTSVVPVRIGSRPEVTVLTV